MDNYFNSNLKFIREQRGISQNKLADMINVNQTTIARWEDENRIPTIEKAIDVSSVLNIPIDDFIGTDLRITSFTYKEKSQDEKFIELIKKAEQNHNLKMVFEKTGDLNDKELNKLEKLIDLIKDENDS